MTDEPLDEDMILFRRILRTADGRYLSEKKHPGCPDYEKGYALGAPM